MIRDKSTAIFTASKKRMPGGVNSPIRAFSGLEMTPLVAERGEGAYVWDADGNRYLDYCGSWGSLILGHAHPEIVAAATHQLKQGTSFGMATPYELALAEKIYCHFPSMEKLRFVSSGTEATMSAIRVARGATGRQTLIKFIGHYHGHSDPFLVQAGSGVLEMNSTASSKGVPAASVQHTLSLPFNDLAICRSLLRSRDDIAAVILEPVAANMGVIPATQEFLEMLREETERKGIVLIFDEVITGFRLSLGGAQHLYGITPDLTCLGKIIGGGFPAAAFGGRKELMDHLAPLGEVYQAGTLSGNPMAMCAGLKTIQLLEQPGFYNRLENLTLRLVEALKKKFTNEKTVGVISHIGSMFTPFFGVSSISQFSPLDHHAYTRLFKTLFHQHIYFSPSPYEANFISAAHDDQAIDQTVQVLSRNAFQSFFFK